MISMNPFFSIIIPVYNVAPYLRECLDSVLAQTFADWEAICVDDGSTDGSGAILDEYAAKDDRVRVIHQENAGVSAARNAALLAVQGKWYLFLDGDDAIRSDALAQFIPYAKTDLTDGILCYPYSPQKWYGNEFPPRRHATKLLLENALKENLFLGKYAANGFVVSRLYRYDKFSSLRFRSDIAFLEDVCFWFDAILISARWSIVECDYYLYRQHDASVSRRLCFEFCNQTLESVLYAFKCIEQSVPRGGDVAKISYFERFKYHPLRCVRHVLFNCENDREDETQEFIARYKHISRQIGRKEWGFWVNFEMTLFEHKGLRMFLPIARSLEYVCALPYRCLRKIKRLLSTLCCAGELLNV